ncbi:hypothetical protein ACT3OH_01815 [Vreelandella zhanjiangensis]|uniref:hypothetical protein n=1 Tax=Vreelandella zhanjiangensis TaxID=1121960 RepID=UPI00402A9D79
MGKLYNEEKVLYFANEEKGLHVSVREEDDTDLSGIVRSLLTRKYIERVAADDSGLYYKTTAAGEARLLNLQIQWRERYGKPVTKHKARLKELQSH